MKLNYVTISLTADFKIKGSSQKLLSRFYCSSVFELLECICITVFFPKTRSIRK